MNSFPTPISISFHLFSCTFHGADELGMEIGHGDDPEWAINDAFSKEALEDRDFYDMDDLVEFLSHSLSIGIAVKRVEGGIEFHYSWYGGDHYERAIFTRVYCKDSAVLDFLWDRFQKIQYDPYKDAQDWIETERDRYAPEL